MLEQLIHQQAVVVRAQQKGADEDPAIRRRMRAAADRVLGEEFMTRELSKGITETALFDRYNRDIAGQPGPEETRVRVILTATEKEAVGLLAELRAGADFAAVARRASIDTTAPAGGDLGFQHARQDGSGGRRRRVLHPTGPTGARPGARGRRVVPHKVEERRPRPTPPFAAVREQLRLAMMREGVTPLADAALKDLKVRRFNFSGDGGGGRQTGVEMTAALIV